MPKLFETFKPMLDWLRTYNIEITAVASALAILAAIWVALKYGRGCLVKTWRFFTRFQPKVPRETIRVLPQLRAQWWSMGTLDGKPAMHIVGDWFVTNITGENIRILGTRLISPRVEGMVDVKQSDRNIFGGYPIFPRVTTEIRADFWIQPPIRKEGEDFKMGLVLIDQFKNEHKVKGVIFKGPKPKEAKKVETVEESIYAIKDPIEKEIAAVLKAELARYRECGRRVGGLGSIQTSYQGGKPMPGVGAEWRDANSPKNQSIDPSPESAWIESDNATALGKLYRGLNTDEEKQRFISFLLKRLSRHTEYAPVGYLILFVLFHFGYLQETRRTAKRDLRGDGSFGFSEFVRVLDGLLRFKHPSFTADHLDEVERFIEGIEETFRIPERIAAIRAFRLVNKKEATNQ